MSWRQSQTGALPGCRVQLYSTARRVLPGTAALAGNGKGTTMATEVYQVYKCEKCGNIVEVLHRGAPSLVCCGEPMKLLEEHSADSSVEKHVPVVETTDAGVKVKVGSVPHPMAEEHFIEWIQVISGNREYKTFLKPGGEPEAEFPVSRDEITAVREYCSVHGLWKG